MLNNLISQNLIQLQVECSQSSGLDFCCTCNKSFEMPNAQVIACNPQGKQYGIVCARCISKGVSWIEGRLQRSQVLQLS
jgi:hypothetical protein